MSRRNKVDRHKNLKKEMDQFQVGDIVKLIKPWNQRSRELLDKIGVVTSIDNWCKGIYNANIYTVKFEEEGKQWDPSSRSFRVPKLTAEGDCFEFLFPR